MTHSPTFLAHELISAACPTTPEEELNADPCVRALVKREMDTMQAARAVLWPCAQAQEGYPEWWTLFQAGKAACVYAATGAARPEQKIAGAEMRRQWGIAPDRRIALFIGRPHPHKGFDRFVDWADLNRRRGNSRWVFVHCGNSAASTRDLSSVHLAGYVSDNGAAYLAADLVLIPNKYSYFDLGMLEALSLGAPLALSPTGGHDYLTRTYPVIPTIPDGPAEVTWPCLEEIAEDYAADPTRRQALRALWEQQFSLRPFYTNHTNLAGQLLKIGAGNPPGIENTRQESASVLRTHNSVMNACPQDARFVQTKIFNPCYQRSTCFHSKCLLHPVAGPLGSASPFVRSAVLGVTHIVGGAWEPVGHFRRSQFDSINHFHTLHQAMILVAYFVLPAAKASPTVDTQFFQFRLYGMEGRIASQTRSWVAIVRTITPRRQHLMAFVDQFCCKHAFQGGINQVVEVYRLVRRFAYFRHQAPLRGDVGHIVGTVVAEDRDAIEGTVLFREYISTF